MVGKIERWVCMLVCRLQDRKICRCWLLGRQVSRLGLGR